MVDDLEILIYLIGGLGIVVTVFKKCGIEFLVLGEKGLKWIN